MRQFFLLLALLAIPAIASDYPETLIPKPRSFEAEMVELKVGDLPIIYEEDAGIPVEGYKLMIGEEQVVITSSSPAGAFYARQTLDQLTDHTGYAPLCEVEDFPRFAWRGMHLDVARHFQPADYIKRYIDILAYHKINTFHWHLTDGIGWRIEIDRYPLLTQKGAWRKIKDERAPWIGFEVSEQGAENTYGGYYTKEEIRDIVRYAAERFITIVPEIEMPGHSDAATTCYPEYCCPNGNPAHGVYCPGNDETFTFLENILDEVMELFPGTFIHIGGDEVEKAQWAACPLCQQRMKDEKLASEEELQSWFVRRIERYISSKGKRMIGWDEIIQGGLAEGAVVMSWTGFEGGEKAARSGHAAVMCPLDYVYLDHYQSQSVYEPQGWGGDNTLRRVYAFDPVPPGLEPEYAPYILGGQGNIWTENIRTPEHIEYMLLPRLAALSEVLWSDREERDWDSFRNRIAPQLRRYERQGWNYAESVFTPFVTEQYFREDGALVLKLDTEYGKNTIRYTLDGTEPTARGRKYADSILVTEHSTLIARTFRNDREAGYPLELPDLLHKATRKPVAYLNRYDPAYSGGGDGALTDNLLAGKRGDDPRWQGLPGEDMSCVIDLQDLQWISGVRVRFFQHLGSTSVVLPRQVEVFLSADGVEFESGSLVEIAQEENPDAFIRTVDCDLQKDGAPRLTRFIRIQAVNPVVFPGTALRAGGQPWVFADEVAVY